MMMLMAIATQVHEFTETVNEWAPKKRRELEAWLNIKVGRQVPAMLEAYIYRSLC